MGGCVQEVEDEQRVLMIILFRKDCVLTVHAIPYSFSFPKKNSSSFVTGYGQRIGRGLAIMISFSVHFLMLTILQHQRLIYV